MTIHSPDDELDERWKAMHEHPQFAAIPSFDALDLAEKAHANDPEPDTSDARHMAQGWKKRRISPDHTEADQTEDEDDEDRVEAGEGGVYEDGPHDDAQQAGHLLLHQEFQNWMSHPLVVEVDDDPL